MKKTRDTMGDFDGCIHWLLRFSPRNSSSCFCLTRASGYTLVLKLQVSGTSSMVWSHCFRSGNSSNDSLVKISQNSWYGLGTMFSKHVDEVPPAALASFWEMVWVALISSDQAPTNRMRSRLPSSSLSGSGRMNPGEGSASMRVDSDSGTSSTCTRQWRWVFGCFRVVSADMRFSRSISSVAFGLHDIGHLIIEISPMRQSISGLCSMSHVCPRIIVVWPIPVTWNVAHLEWSLYWTIRSTTSVICPASLGVPS